MNAIKFMVALACIVGFLYSAGGGGVRAADKPLAKTTAVSVTNVVWISDTVCSYKCGEWELRIKYLQKGSRSEGQDGTLLKNGKEVDYTKSGNLLDTDLGKLRHYGTERKVAWALTGWNFADRRRVKNSAAVRETGKSKK